MFKSQQKDYKRQFEKIIWEQHINSYGTEIKETNKKYVLKFVIV